MHAGFLLFRDGARVPRGKSWGNLRSCPRSPIATVHTGSAVAGELLDRVADDYEELDRYAFLAVRWAWGFYLRWRAEREAEMRRRVPRGGRHR